MNCADPSDQASLAEQHRLDTAIQRALSNKDSAPALRAVGKCHYCEEPTPTGHRFCDAACREDYDYMQRRRSANA